MVFPVKKKKGEKFEKPWRFSFALLWWCSTCFGTWDSQFQGGLALDQSRRLTQKPFEACSAVGNEKERSTQYLSRSEREVLAFYQQYWFFLVWQPAQPTRSVALSFLRGFLGAWFSASLYPSDSRWYQGCVTRVKRSCDKSCDGSTLAVQLLRASGWKSG